MAENIPLEIKQINQATNMRYFPWLHSQQKVILTPINNHGTVQKPSIKKRIGHPICVLSWYRLMDSSVWVYDISLKLSKRTISYGLKQFYTNLVLDAGETFLLWPVSAKEHNSLYTFD